MMRTPQVQTGTMRQAMSACLIGIIGGATLLASVAMAEPEAVLVFGPKLMSEHKVRSVVGPSVRIDDEGRIALAWIEEDKDARTVLYARTEKLGGPIGASVKVNQPAELPYIRQEAPAIAGTGDKVFITWASTHPKASPEKPFSNELRLSRSVDGGKTFLPSILVNDDEQIVGHSFDSVHVAPDGVVHVAWIDAREGKKEPGTFVAKSTDQGRSVTRNVKIDENACVCCRTALATSPEGIVYVAWRKVYDGNVRETVVARSTNGGETFSAPVIVGNDRWVYPACPHRPASVAVDRSGRLYVVWYTEGADETPAIYLAYSDDQGATFSPKQQLNQSKGTFPDHPQMAVDPEGRVVLVWEEQSPVRREVVVRVSLDRGQTFNAPRKVNDKKGQTPSLSINSNGLVALAWMEHAMPNHRMVVQTIQLPAAKIIARQEP